VQSSTFGHGILSARRHLSNKPATLANKTGGALKRTDSTTGQIRCIKPNVNQHQRQDGSLDFCFLVDWFYQFRADFLFGSLLSSSI